MRAVLSGLACGKTSANSDTWEARAGCAEIIALLLGVLQKVVRDLRLLAVTNLSRLCTVLRSESGPPCCPGCAYISLCKHIEAEESASIRTIHHCCDNRNCCTESHLGADRMHTPIARYHLAVSIALEAGYRILAAALQLAAQHVLGMPSAVARCHGRDYGCGCVSRPGRDVECRGSSPMRSGAPQKCRILHEWQEHESRAIDSQVDGIQLRCSQHGQRQHHAQCDVPLPHLDDRCAVESHACGCRQHVSKCTNVNVDEGEACLQLPAPGWHDGAWLSISAGAAHL
jgi:hypothetical protein